MWSTMLVVMLASQRVPVAIRAVVDTRAGSMCREAGDSGARLGVRPNEGGGAQGLQRVSARRRK